MSADSFLVVIDPTTTEQPALERAIQSSHMTGRGLHLFECVHESYAKPPDITQNNKDALLNFYKSQLSTLENKVRLENIEVSSELVYQKSWREAIIKASQQNECVMVFKPSYFHTRAERSEDTSDWTLLRNCPRPVMLIHNKSRWENRRVLAAIHLSTDDARHQKLDRNIINIASTLRDVYEADVHFIHAIQKADMSKAIDDDDLLLPNSWSGNQNSGKKTVFLSVDAVAQHCQVDTDHAHLCEGYPTEVILKKARELDVDLIVVGTLSRQGIKARILGNTVESLLDDIDCDILTIHTTNSSL